MANILIVHAHPEPRSFSSALARTAVETFERAGHTVAFSDLYAAAFDPVHSRRNFRTVAKADYFKPQAEELHATRHAGFAPELEAEIRRLEACDLLVFSFPLWWFGLPAILKGWIDRVFAYGRIYGEGRWYERGIGQGKRAMVIMTTGSPPSAFGHRGLHAPLESILTPVHHGVFWFNGYAPLRPFVTWSAAHITSEARAAELAALRTRLADIWQETPMLFRREAEHQKGTWIDAVPRFLVTASRKAQAGAADALSPRDWAELRELRRTGQLVRASLANAEAKPWQAAFEIRALDTEAALALLRPLPMGEWCDLMCAPLDPGLEEALSPYWRPERQ
jgi:NAD(P)H dehydrogenase (quinone)